MQNSCSSCFCYA